ncbi:MAG: Na/Pi cotransporter family protein [Lachnospiraceae bacterium]|nr:Na/Pi cotransporter family protein [Lachnospiraceae bacterium]
MNFFDFLPMIGGLALFLFGMNLLSDGLSKVSGGRLEKILEKLTSNPLKAVLLGAGVTALIQSSSATTVMVVGFVNSGIMKLQQAVGIIMGANIGTTATAWILSLAGLEGDNFLVQLCKPTSFSPILAIIGVAMIMFSKKERKQDVGGILIGFAILMIGMDMMSAAVKPLADVPEFTSLMTMFKHPLMGMLAGAVLTAIIQSSSASVGILQALALTGAIPISTAVPIIMGQNIGTCVTAMLSAIGASKNAKRTAFVHLYFNLIGTTIFMIVFYSVNALIGLPFINEAANAGSIALIHSIFNIFATLILLPFSKGLVKLASLTVRDDVKEEKLSKVDMMIKTLDDRFLDTPSLAIDHCQEVCCEMAHTVKESLFLAMEQIENYSDERNEQVHALEDDVDRYEDALGTYLVKIGSQNVSERDSYAVSIMLHSIGDFERISDHAVSISESAKEATGKEQGFSNKAIAELNVLMEAVKEVLTTSVVAFDTKDLKLATNVEPLEDAIDDLSDEVKARHIKRLRKGKCTIEMGFVLSDITTSLERVADHCSNIAVCLLEASEESLGVHEYVGALKQPGNQDFEAHRLLYKTKYALPE